MIKKQIIKQNGFSIVEVMLAASLFIIFSTGTVVALISSMDANRLSSEQTIATQFGTEGIEAMRSIKNRGFANLTNTAGTGIAQSNGVWIYRGTNNIFDTKYQRIISVLDVQRDVSGNIVVSGGIIDPAIKKVNSTVSWNVNPVRQNSVVLETYLSNWKEKGRWSIPVIDSSFDLTVANSGNNNSDAISLALANNKLYVGRANNSGSEFYIFDVTNPSVMQLLGRRDLDGDPNDIAVYGNYAYIASSDNSSELQIIDISNPATINQVGKLTTVNLTNSNSGSNNADAAALVTDGNYLYMIRNGGDEFLVFNLSIPANPGNPIGRTDSLTGTLYDLVISGNYVFVASGENHTEVQTVDVTNKTIPNRTGVLDLNSGSQNSNPLALEISGNHLFVARVQSNAPELYIIDTTNPNALALIQTYEVGFDINSLSYSSDLNLLFMATNDTANDLKIVDLSNINSPVILSQLNVPDSPIKIIYDGTLDRVFCASNANNAEIYVIAQQ